MTKRVAGLVLAGGQSRRMGGGDKFMLELGGQTLLERAIGRLEPQAAQIAISANCDPALLADYSRPVLADPPPAGRGPLAGILAGLEWASGLQGANHLVTVASDTPFFPLDLADKLLASATDNSETIVLAASAGRTHPVFGLWPVSTREPLREWLEASRSLKVTHFTADHGHRICDFPLDGLVDPFFNVNTPDELAEAKRLLAETTS